MSRLSTPLLAVEPGEVVALLGPNGAGKTTLLRQIAGLARVPHGAVTFGDNVWDDGASTCVSSRARRVGMVFQDYQLFEHLSVAQNIGYGPRSHGARRADVAATSRRLLDEFDLTGLADRRPSHLSGGERQRVALARAFAIEPSVLLLDEPFAALDALGRTKVHALLRERLTTFAGPALLVSHDPMDAIAMCDRIVVIEDGSVSASGSASSLAREPGSAYVAALFGTNHYTGRASGGQVQIDGGGSLWHSGDATSGPVTVSLAPTAITLYRDEPHELSARNCWPGRIASLESLRTRVRLQVVGAPSAYVEVTEAAVEELGIAVGSQVWLTAKATEVMVRST